MNRTLLTLLAASTLAAAPQVLSAQAKTSISIAGGLSAPVSSLGDLTDMGYNVAAGINLTPALSPIGLRFEGGYNGFNVSGGDGDVRIISVTANAVFNLTKLPDSPYLIGGLGYYNQQFTTGSNSFEVQTSRSAAGVNIGGGLRFPLGGLSTFFEARYHVMFADANGGASSQFIPITFGIAF